MKKKVDSDTFVFRQVFTYAMLCGSAFKVGRSESVGKRLKSLQTGNPERVSVLGAIKGNHEREIHRYLERNGVRRLSGEWFLFDEKAKAALITKKLASSSTGFAGWLQAQAHRDDPIGDLACDSQADLAWPLSDESRPTIRKHLADRGACSQALVAFRDAWKEWAAQ